MVDSPKSSSSNYKEVKLGSTNIFTSLPCLISIDQENYFLVQNQSGRYSLLSDVCPHMWGTIIIRDDCFLCPDHGWRFDLSKGICINGPRSQMYNIDVINRNGILFAQFQYQ
ncbi:MAG: hypothetical protein CL886_09625 [Dehalococcoidia bacterium]|nr:hypothetical protein [Dehalococcoidia bacterium]